MAMQSVKDLCVYDLSLLRDVEQEIAKFMPNLIQEIGNSQAQGFMQDHERESHQQIRNLDQCFKILGTQPEQVTGKIIPAVKQEHADFKQQSPSSEILALFDLGLADTIERYEMTCYRGLIEKMHALGQSDCARLLQDNLEQEEDEAHKVERASRRLTQQLARPGQRQQQGQMRA